MVKKLSTPIHSFSHKTKRNLDFAWRVFINTSYIVQSGNCACYGSGLYFIVLRLAIDCDVLGLGFRTVQ